MNYIPFLNSKSDAQLAKKYFGNSACFRVRLLNARSIISELPRTSKIWIDPCFDGFPLKNPGEDWVKFFSAIQKDCGLIDQKLIDNPKYPELKALVFRVLDECNQHNPEWLSIPQLPHTDDTSHNRINRHLTKAFNEWKGASRFRGTIILPAVFLSQKQLNNKTNRSKKIVTLRKTYLESGADGIWAVDESLSDQLGTATFETKRFPGIIELHEELSRFPNVQYHMGGPYWGLNIVLWARGLITNPAIAVGSGYQYYRAGGQARQAKKRIAIPALRRWAVDTAEMKDWLQSSITALAKDPNAKKQFETLAKEHSKLDLQKNGHKEQIVSFYKNWIEMLENVPKPSRALTLYQDLSQAYVIGRSLPKLNSETGRAKHPGIVAKQLMLNCL